MDTEGNMRELSAIAMDAKAAFGDVTDLEALTAMLEDMNVRGATAFALLVQNADEYKAAVSDLANSAGEATMMADTQQQSLALQIQRVKNALMAPFLLSDKVGEANNTLNAFTHQIKLLTDEFVGFFIEELPDGTMKLNENGDMIKDFVIEALKELVVIIVKLKKIFLESNSGLANMTKLLHMAMVPLNVMLDVLSMMPDSTLRWIVQLKLMAGILPITTFFSIAQTISQVALNITLVNGTKISKEYAASMIAVGKASAVALGGFMALFVAGAYLNNWGNGAINVLGAVTGAFIAAGVGVSFFKDSFKFGSLAGITALAAGAALGIGVARLGKTIGGQMSNSNLGNTSDYESYDIPMADTGYTNIPMADTGFSSKGRHFPVMVEPGESIVSKTQTMLGGGGITLNIGGDIVTSDADDFAERIAVALPEALRRHNDIGGI
jgi:hypothetical protein